ncbi:M14 family metallopeptidase [Caldithrix abyssi]
MKKRSVFMLRIILIFLLIMSVRFLGQARADDWQTYCEKSQFKATPDYAQTMAFCEKLADFSPWIQFISFGKSAQGRDLPLLIVNKDGRFDPQAINREQKLVALVQAGIHAGEIDGKDAGFIFLRDLVVHKKHASLLDHVVLLFIPIFNVDGHERSGPYNRINQNGPQEMGWRTTAVNLNLNRDHLKADAVEMQAWLKLFNRWLPDFFVDVHVTDGADYQYVVTYNMDTHGVLDGGLNQFLKSRFIPALEHAMQENNLPIIQYVMFKNHYDPKSGMLNWVPSPRFSHGYTLLHNRPGLLIENHMLKDYRTRVNATYHLLETLFDLFDDYQAPLRRLIKQADRATLDADFLARPFPLTFRRTGDSTMIDFLGFEYQTLKSDVSGGLWYRYDNARPKTFRIPFYDFFVPERVVNLPLAYLVPVEWKTVIDRLALHGITYFELSQDMELNLETYRFKEVKFASSPYEGRQMVRFKSEPTHFKRIYHKGSVIVPVKQRTARVIAHILEPDAPDSFVRWGFFNAIFEKKEYAESYVMEALARKMLAEDDRLRARFQEKMQADSAFARNPRAILNWFYRHSPYWDRFKDIYPVGKITDAQLLNHLLKGVN